MWVLIYIKREVLGNPVVLPHWYRGIYAFCFAAFSVAVLFLILAYFLRFKHSGWSILDPMQPEAYGMFLVHYPIVRLGCNIGCSTSTSPPSPRLLSRSC